MKSEKDTIGLLMKIRGKLTNNIYEIWEHRLISIPDEGKREIYTLLAIGQDIESAFKITGYI